MQLEDVEVLVVDDVNTVRHQVKGLLEESGFKRIMLLDDAEAARNHLQRKTCHVVICDWHMPGESGLDLLIWARSNPKLKYLIFTLLTAEQTKAAVLKAIQAGVDDYMIKPFTRQQITDKIMWVLRKRKILW